MNTSQKVFMADMLLKMSFVAYRSCRIDVGQIWCLLPLFCHEFFQVCISGFVFCPSENIPVWYVDGKRPRAELKLCLYNL